jgi:hypothetical protein
MVCRSCPDFSTEKRRLLPMSQTILSISTISARHKPHAQLISTTYYRSLCQIFILSEIHISWQYRKFTRPKMYFSQITRPKTFFDETAFGCLFILQIAGQLREVCFQVFCYVFLLKFFELLCWKSFSNLEGYFAMTDTQCSADSNIGICAWR